MRRYEKLLHRKPQGTEKTLRNLKRNRTLDGTTTTTACRSFVNLKACLIKKTHHAEVRCSVCRQLDSSFRLELDDSVRPHDEDTSGIGTVATEPHSDCAHARRRAAGLVGQAPHQPSVVRQRFLIVESADD